MVDVLLVLVSNIAIYVSLIEMSHHKSCIWQKKKKKFAFRRKNSYICTILAWRLKLWDSTASPGELNHKDELAFRRAMTAYQ